MYVCMYDSWCSSFEKIEEQTLETLLNYVRTSDYKIYCQLYVGPTYEEKLTEMVKSDPKSFWKYANSLEIRKFSSQNMW